MAQQGHCQPGQPIQPVPGLYATCATSAERPANLLTEVRAQRSFPQRPREGQGGLGVPRNGLGLAGSGVVF
jgi:hypothetical protein